MFSSTKVSVLWTNVVRRRPPHGLYDLLIMVHSSGTLGTPSLKEMRRL